MFSITLVAITILAVILGMTLSNTQREYIDVSTKSTTQAQIPNISVVEPANTRASQSITISVTTNNKLHIGGSDDFPLKSSPDFTIDYFAYTVSGSEASLVEFNPAANVTEIVIPSSITYEGNTYQVTSIVSCLSKTK